MLHYDLTIYLVMKYYDYFYLHHSSNHKIKMANGLPTLSATISSHKYEQFSAYCVHFGLILFLKNLSNSLIAVMFEYTAYI